MQAITVRQPLAWAIARGHRRLSNQALPTAYRGPVLIYASMRIELNACDLIRAAGWDRNDPLAALGAIIAVADLSDVCSAAAGAAKANDSKNGGKNGGKNSRTAECGCGSWADPDLYHWRLSDIQALPRPVLTVGQPGLWLPPPGLVADVRAVLATADVNR